MKTPATIALVAALLSPLHSQTVLEWAMSETSPSPDVDDTANLNGTLDVPIIGDGVTSSITNSQALMGRFTPVTLASVNDSITISYEILCMGGTSGSGTNANLRWGLFNSNVTTFGGDEANFSGWTGSFAVNSGAATNDADIYVRNIGNTDRFYVSTGATDVTSGTVDVANQNFDANGVIYTATMTVTRLAGDVMDISTTLTGDDGYTFSLTGQETTNAEFTFDRVGFWINALNADLVAFKATSAPPSTDGDSIPDLEEIRWFNDLTTADDSTNSDGDALTDLQEITESFTDPTDPNDPPAPLTEWFVDFNADGTAGQTGPNLESGSVAFTAPHESNTIDDPAGIDYPVFGTTVNLAVDYTDDSGFTSYDPAVKQMIGRGNAQAGDYEGTLTELMRDWVGVDSRAPNGNGPVGNEFGSPTNMTFTLTGLPAGTYQYRAYHHDVAGIQGNFELTVTDATRTDASLGSFQMTSSLPTGGNPVFDATGNKGTAGVDASTLSFAVGQEPPAGAETRTLFAANIGQAVVSGGALEVYLDDFPASATGTSNDRTWLQGIGYKSSTGTDITYVDVTLANTDIVGGGADSLWADGDDATTGGSTTDGAAANDGLWRFRSGFGNGGIWEATGSSTDAEDCVEIVTTAAVPNDTYDVYVFYYPVTGSGDYPVRAGLASATPAPGTNPGADNPPTVLPSTLTIPFESDGNPVVFTYRVYEEPGDESLSVVGVNGFEITEFVPGFRVTSIVRSGTDITLTWLSQAGKNYDINAGIDLMGFPTLVADDVPSQGVTTSHTFPLPAGLVAEPKVFFVVEQNP